MLQGISLYSILKEIFLFLCLSFRAVYKDADLYLLDSPFGYLDMLTEKEIFERYGAFLSICLFI